MFKKVLTALLCAAALVGIASPVTAQTQKAITIGVIVYNLTDPATIEMKKKIDALGKGFDIKLKYATADSADSMVVATENLIAAGANGILAMTVEAMDTVIAKCEAAKVYLVAYNARVYDPAKLAALQKSPYYLGTIADQEKNVYSEMTKTALTNGAKEIGLVAPTGMNFGFFGVRKQAVLDTVAAWNKEKGTDIKVKEGTGVHPFDWAGITNNILSTNPNINALIGIAASDELYQTLVTANKQGSVKFYATNIGTAVKAAFDAGSLQMLYTNSESMTPAFVLMYNQLKGTPLSPKYLEPELPSIVIKNAQQLAGYQKLTKGATLLYSLDYLKGINTLAKFQALCANASLEKILAGTHNQ